MPASDIKSLATLAWIFSLIMLSPVSAQVFAPRIIAISGTEAPGTGGAFWPGNTQAFFFPSVNENGHVTFFGGLTGAGITTNVNDSGIWVSTSAGLQLIMQKGSAAPGVSGATFSNIDTFGAIGNNAAVAFRGTLTGGGTTAANNSGIWSGTSINNVQLVMRGGDVAPGTGGATWSNYSGTPLVLPDGRIVLFNSLVAGGSVTAGNDSGIWMGTPGNLSLYYREGSAAPGLAGVNLGAANFSGMNAAGKSALRTTLSGSGVTTSNNSVMLAGSDNNFQILMRTGSTPVGLPAGVTVNGFNAISAVLDNGHVFFAASLTGTGVTTANDGATWVGDNSGNLSMVFREGNQVPGLASGVNFAAANAIYRANGNTVVYRSTLAGTGVTTTNDEYVGAWNSSSGIQVVAREGDAVPGLTDVQFGRFFDSSMPLFNGQVPAVAPDGTIAFRGDLVGTGTSSSNNAAIFIRYSDGVLRVLARKGDVIDLGNGLGTGTIADLALNDNINGINLGYSAITPNGDLSWLATLTDGRTVILFTPTPEPACVLGVASIGVVLLPYLRRRFLRQHAG